MELDWHKSKAHLLLLSKYISANSFYDFAQHEYWKSWWNNLLGEPSTQAIKRFVDEGMLTTPELNELLSYKYKVNELKDMLKQKGLPVSGRKEEMIKRLVKADPDGILKSVAELSLLKCTQRGHEIAEQYIKANKEKIAQVEHQVMEYLIKRKFKEASLAVATYEAEDGFSSGMGIKRNPEREIEELKTIFESKPKIIARLGNEKLEAVRIAAAMTALWGTTTKSSEKWLPASFETGLFFDSETAVRMFVFFGRHRAELERYRSEGLKLVEVLSAPDACESCKKLTGKHYKINDVPELPYEHCTHKMGCRCTFLPVV
jgi:hypothetical protein